MEKIKLSRELEATFIERESGGGVTFNDLTGDSGGFCLSEEELQALIKAALRRPEVDYHVRDHDR